MVVVVVLVLVSLPPVLLPLVLLLPLAPLPSVLPLLVLFLPLLLLPLALAGCPVVSMFFPGTARPLLPHTCTYCEGSNLMMCMLAAAPRNGSRSVTASQGSASSSTFHV